MSCVCEIHANHQLEYEMSKEIFDRRRVMLLKSQVVQLEKQVVVMTNALSSLKKRLAESEALVLDYNNFLQHILKSQKDSRSITVSKSELETQIDRANAVLHQIHQTQGEQCGLDSEIFVCNKKFLRQSTSLDLKEYTSGNLKHINLSQVTNLEDKLARLYGELYSSKQTSLMYDRNMEHLKSSLDVLCEDLLSLSLLVPNTPWSKRYSLPEVTTQSVMSAFPKLTHTKQVEVRQVIDSVLKLAEHRHRLERYKSEALEAELKHMRTLEASQVESSKSTFTSFLSQYQEFISSLKETLTTPLLDIMIKFEDLAQTPGDALLKQFLVAFKEIAPQAQEVCQSIESLRLDDATNLTLPYGDQQRIQKSLKKLKLYKEALEDQETETRAQELEERRKLQSMLQDSMKTEHVTRSTGYMTPPKPNAHLQKGIKQSRSLKNHRMSLGPDSNTTTSFTISSEGNEQVQTADTKDEQCEECSIDTTKQQKSLIDSLTSNHYTLSPEEESSKMSTVIKKQPNWLLEMKDDLKKKEQDANSGYKATESPRGSKGVKGVAMSKLSLKPRPQMP